MKMSHAHFYADVTSMEMLKLEYEYNFGVKMYVLEASLWGQIWWKNSQGHLYDDVTRIEMLKLEYECSFSVKR